MENAFNKEDAAILDENQTEFVGYESKQTEAIIRRVKTSGDIAIILDKSTFYAESGGQVGDIGTISGSGFEFTVTNTQMDDRGVYYHIGKFTKGSPKEIKKGMKVIKWLRSFR